MGGILAFNQGTMRVNGVLAVSRAIGDVQYKPYVTSIPDTQCIPLNGTEDFLIIATDGVWDFINSHEAAAIVYIAIRQYPDDPDYAATSLIKAAKYAGSLDNITAIVVFLTAPSEIAARPSDAHPLLSLDSMINMAVNNPYVQKDLCAIDGMFFKQMKQYQQHPPPYDNDQEERHANGSEASMDDGGFHDEITGGAEGKHEENDAADYIYGDLGPETDVDAVDDVDNVLESPILDNAPGNLSQGLFHEEKRLPENENDFRHEEEEEDATLDAPLDAPHDVLADTPLDDDDSPPSPVNNDTKPLQHALLPEADNVADSEDSEDEWNYYRVGPNKEKDTAASSGELHEIKNDNEAENDQHLDEDNNVEPQSSSSEVDSECESQKEEILPELINTDISVEEKRKVDSPFVKTEKEEEVQEEETEEEEEEEGERVEKNVEEEKQEEEDMEFQLNPNAAEFIPGSPPKHQIKLSSINDSLVAGSPLKSVAMDDIKVPSQKEFDEEISVRPHEIEEKDSPNGDHISHSDYDFYTERQKVTSAPVGLDESEISSTKAEYGDESNMSSLYTTDLHKTGISTMEESFGESECDIYNRDNPMTMSYTPSDFKAAFKKEVDLNAVHDLSDGDLEDENGSFEEQTPRSPTVISADIVQAMESSVFSNGESSDQVQSFTGSLQGETTFLKFGDSEESKTTEFMKVELERHQSSPIDSVFEQDIPRQEEESHLAQDNEELVDITQEEENEKIETHKEALDGEEKDIAEIDIVKSETEHIVEKPVEVATADLIETEVPHEASFQDTNFLSSTIQEAPKSAASMESTPRSMSPIGTEHIETSSKPLETEVISSMENLALAAEEASSVVSNLRPDVPEFQPCRSSFDPFASGEPLLSDVVKASHLDDSMDLMAEPTESEKPTEPSFVPTLTSESVSDERPTESLLDFNDTATEMPTKDHIEEAKVEESSVPTFEESADKPTQDIDESVCLFDINAPVEAEKQTNSEAEEEFETIIEKTEEMNIAEVEQANEMPTLNLSESIQEFTGLEKQLEPENVTPEESPVTEPPTIEDKIIEEVVEHKEEPLVKETIDEDTIIDTKKEEEEIVKVEEHAEIVHVEETPQPADTEEVMESSKTTEFMAPVDNIETEASADTIELATPADSVEMGTPVDTAEIATPVDTAETATPVDTAEIAMPTDTAETAAPVDTAEIATPVETAEVATLADMAKAATSMNVIETEAPTKMIETEEPARIVETEESARIVETEEPATIIETEAPAKIVETETPTSIVEPTNLVDTTTTKPAEIIETADTAKTAELTEAVPTAQAAEEQKATESPEVVKSKVEEATEPTVVAAGVVAAAATVAAAGIVTAAATSTSKAKAKPAAKTTKPGTTTKAAPKSTPTSPSKTISSTTRSTASATAIKKVPASTATRPKQLDTNATKSAASASAAKASAPKTLSASKPATSTTKTAAARPSSSVTKAKAAPTSARSTTAPVEKKSVLNGDVKSLSKGTTTKPASKLTATSSSTSTSAKSTTTKTTPTSRVSASATTTTATKSRPTSATTAARSPAKLSATTSSASGTPNAAKTKTTPTSATKSRTSLPKSPMIDKQIKETANKQISMARTTTSSVSKTTRTSMSSTTMSSVTATATKRLSASKSTTTTTHSPVKKVVSKVASGNSSGTKTSAVTKVKVMQNGTADNVEITKTTIITNIKNEDDVPKKDLSPVVAPTDNQLIVSAD
ncbi:hypothetical protein KPH14_005624 [Odynerus spinipes]|uniref:PPM-type phosphatase domain-containing protein n=1 Tax=Odynerus spinipes TaxID=1348599 RepID=A0AAD9VIV6_9HYME|nr:hypothetical protein KPH14_005624 [Odynerus spinipes]